MPATFSITASSNQRLKNSVVLCNAPLPKKLMLIFSNLVVALSNTFNLPVNLPNIELPIACIRGSASQNIGPIDKLLENDNIVDCFANPPDVKSRTVAQKPSCHPMSLDIQSSPTRILIIGSTNT